jgi:prepilin-type N-terminal cleavage/methylation domain-containing protein
MDWIDITRSRRGFSLIELMMVTTATVMICTAVSTTYVGSHRIYQQGETFSEVHSGIRMALDWMSRDIKWATRMMNSKNGYYTGTDELVLEVPSIDGDGNIINIDEDYDYIIYHLDGQDASNVKLMRTLDASTASARNDETRVIAKNLNSLVFSSDGMLLGSISDVTTLAEVVIELSAAKPVSGGTIHNEQRSTVIELRNHY